MVTNIYLNNYSFLCLCGFVSQLNSTNFNFSSVFLRKFFLSPNHFILPCPSLGMTLTHSLSTHKMSGYSLQCVTYLVILFWDCEYQICQTILIKVVLITTLQQEYMNALSKNFKCSVSFYTSIFLLLFNYRAFYSEILQNV